MAKLSRKAIKEGLEQVPMDTLLLGVTYAKEQPLTPKQREFARQVALGETKAQAYRNAYKSKGKPNTVGQKGYELAKRDEMQVMIDAFRLANEVEKQQTPAQLRRLVITQLTQHALDESFPPAQRVKALELLGKVSEVAAFTERKETTITHQSGDIKARLMEQLKQVIDITPKQEDDADDLLLEIAGSQEQENLGGLEQGYGTGTPPNEQSEAEIYTHNAPHTQSYSESNPHTQSPVKSNPHTQSVEISNPHAPEISAEEVPHPSDMETHPVSEETGLGTGGNILEKSAGNGE